MLLVEGSFLIENSVYYTNRNLLAKVEAKYKTLLHYALEGAGDAYRDNLKLVTG